MTAVGLLTCTQQINVNINGLYYCSTVVLSSRWGNGCYR